MIKFKIIPIISTLLLTTPLFGTFHLDAPKGWDCVSDTAQLPKKVQCIYIGTAQSALRPTLNVAVEPTNETLNNYYAAAKSYHISEPDTHCNDLGVIITKCGQAKMMQIDRVSTWGNVRFIQASIIIDQVAYVITGTCLREDFSACCATFFDTIQSFNVEK